MAFDTRWRQVAACLVLLAVSGMIASTYSVLAIPLAGEFRPSRMVLMLAMTALSLVSGVISPTCGSLMDRVSLRAMMGGGAALLVGGFAALSFATSFVQVILVYGLFMAPASVLLGPIGATVLISRWFDERRGTALGIAISGIALGSALFPPLIQALLGAHDWRIALRLLALILLVVSFAMVSLLRDRPPNPVAMSGAAATDPQAGPNAPPNPLLSTRAILIDPTFWVAAGIFAVIFSGMKGVVTNLVPLAMDEGVPMAKAAWLLSIQASAGFVGKLVFAAVADKLNLRGLLFMNLVGFGAGMSFLIFADAGYWVIALGVGLIGLFGGMVVPIQGFFVGRVFGQRVIGKVSGLLNLTVLCVLLVTPPLFGLIFDRTGNYDMAFMGFAGLAALALLAVQRLRLQPLPTSSTASLPVGAVKLRIP